VTGFLIEFRYTQNLEVYACPDQPSSYMYIHIHVICDALIVVPRFKCMSNLFENPASSSPPHSRSRCGAFMPLSSKNLFPHPLFTLQRTLENMCKVYECPTTGTGCGIEK
jgi:hypothetical protein